MEKGDKLTGGPYWTQNWIEAMWRFTAERFVDFDTGTVDFEALGHEEYEFRKALFFRNFKNSPRAREAFDAAADDYSKKVANGQKGGRPRKNQETTADGDIREDSLANPDGSAITRNETRDHDALEPSATISQDAADGNAADDRKVPTSCPHYDQETCQASTDEARESQALESRRTEGHSLRVGNVARPSVRSGRNSRCPNSREEFHAFVADNNLHEGLAEEWYAIHEARGWVDENGNPIKNWRGALKNYCIKIEQKRRTA